MENGKSKREEVCPGKKLDRAAVERQLKETKGPEYWRSLEELAGSPEFQDMLHREFPKGASEWLDSVSRRGFLQLMGASLAMAGMTGCTKLPLQEIVPYVRQPEQVIPGVAMYYATAFTLSGYANPLLVESHLGRPTKIEGNNLHPASLGGTDVFAQASILGMYDPDRSQAITHLGDVGSWAGFVKEIRGPLAVQKALGGAGIRILTQTISSPTLKDQMQAFRAMYPQAKWHVYEPVNRDNALEGAKLAFGEALETQYRLDERGRDCFPRCRLSLRGLSGECALRPRFREEAQSRRGNEPALCGREHSILDRSESRSPPAAACSGDRATSRKHWRPRIGVNGGGAMDSGSTAKFISAVAGDLQKHKGESVIIAGDHQPPAVHALAHAMNAALGNVGKTVVYTDPVDANPVNQIESLRDLVSDMRAGNVDLLVIMGGNPVYDAPADLGFARLPEKFESRPAHLPRSLPERDGGTLPLERQRGALSRSLERWPRL